MFELKLPINEIFVSASTWVTYQSGTIIPIVILLVNIITLYSKGKVLEWIQKNKAIQIVLAAILGAMPGDATTLILFPLYFTGHISFAALVALGISSVGDSGFVLLQNPKAFFITSLIKIIIAIIVAVIVSILKIDPKFTFNKEKKPIYKEDSLEEETFKKNYSQKKKGDADKAFHPFFDEMTFFDKIFFHSTKRLNENSNFYKVLFHLRHNFLFLIFWILEFVKLITWIFNGFSVEDNTTNQIIRLISITFIIVIVFYYLILKMNRVREYSLDIVYSKTSDFKEMIIHSAEEAALILVRVFIIMFIYKFIVNGIFGEAIVKNLYSLFNGRESLLIFMGAIIGFIPGCALQITFQQIAINLNWSYAVILSNSVSQIGDSAFSFITYSRKMWLTLASINLTASIIISFIIRYFLKL